MKIRVQNKEITITQLGAAFRQADEFRNYTIPESSMSEELVVYWNTVFVEILKLKLKHNLSEKYSLFASLWEELGNIPINEDEEIEQRFLIFPIGTCRMEIWHWFENTFDICLGAKIGN